MNTMQEEFDAVVAHLYKQGKKAMSGKGCAYRGENGTMCAVGCRIPDEMYDPKMEGQFVFSLPFTFSTPPEISVYNGMFVGIVWLCFFTWWGIPATALVAFLWLRIRRNYRNISYLESRREHEGDPKVPLWNGPFM